MTVSSITGITKEGQPLEMASFKRSGIIYVAWNSEVSFVQRRVRWKPHDGADFTEVFADLVTDFRNIATVYLPSSDSVLLAWDDNTGVGGVENSRIFVARFNPLTGVRISGPTLLGPGTRPQMLYRGNVQGNSVILASFLSKTDDVLVRITTDGGLTWSGGAPVLVNKVVGTNFIEAVAYGEDHLSIAQLGGDNKKLSEISFFTRTRPLVSILKHPSNPDQFFIGEPSRITSVAQADNLRGGMALLPDNSAIIKIDGEAQGTSDSIGGIARVSVSGSAISVSASAGPTTGTNRNRIVQYSLTPSISSSADLDVSIPAVSLGVSSTFAYVAQNVESNPTGGQLKVIDLSNLATQNAFLTGVSGRAVAVANFLTPKVIFASTTESSIERIRVYSENGTTPTLLMNSKVSNRVNSIFVAPHLSNPAWAILYVSNSNRLSVMEYRGSSIPLRVLDTVTLTGGGQYLSVARASNGNIVAAAGIAGVVIFGPTGKTLAQLRVSPLVVADWRPQTAYSLNQLVRPTPENQFAQNRYYFRCSTAGTTAVSQPAWAFTGTMTDGSAVWTPVAERDGIVSGVALDETSKRIYCVGVVGGGSNTDGRVWVLNARGFL